MEEESSEMNSWWNIRSWLRWRPTSVKHLFEAEKKILDHVNVPMERKFISISNGYKQIWTVIANKESAGVPIVFVHGFGGGTALWAHNIEPVSQKCPLYMSDLLGFGQSSRPHFSKDAETAELEFVESLEEWRSKLNLDKFILLGHSLGAFVISSYAIKYPERIKHLILVDPWGFPEKPSNTGKSLPFWIRTLMLIVKPFNPLAILRAAGPWGPGLVRRFRSDIGKKYAALVNEELMLDYIYHCNAQLPSGEAAFNTMTQSLGWAVNPMITRINNIPSHVPITMIYGSRSWINSDTGYDVKSRRPEAIVDVEIVKGAGHHVYADKPDDFNALISSLLDVINTDISDTYATEASSSAVSPSANDVTDDVIKPDIHTESDINVLMTLKMDDGADLKKPQDVDSIEHTSL